MQHFKRKVDNIIFPWLEKHLDPSKTNIDIGARKGRWYKNVFNFIPESNAHLFEATPDIAEIAKKNYKNATHVKIHSVALSDEIGTTDFHIDLTRGGWSGLVRQRTDSEYKTITVPVATLDSYMIDNVGFIKIDVEGNELKTLQGSIQTLKKCKPVIYFECADAHLTHYDYSAGDLFDFLNGLDYEIFDLDFNKCTRKKLCYYSSISESYYHNFIAIKNV